MWDCIECGVRRIAASILRCPVCRKERDMATATTGGASNARAVLHETGYVPPEEPAAPEPVEAVETPAEPAVAAEAPEAPVAAETVSEPEPEVPKPGPRSAPKAAGPEPAEAAPEPQEM